MKLLLILLGATLCAQSDKLEAAAAAAAKSQAVPALSIATSNANRTTYQVHLGAANPQTQYRAGSITKLFTAIAVMQMVEAGKLDLDQPVSRYLPELPFPSTIRQILCHRSGIVREPGRGHYFDAKPSTLKQVTASLKPTSLVYKPGTTTKYSNAAITLLGDVIERVSGQSYEAYIQAKILKPLGMASTTFRMADAPRLAKGVMWTTDGRQFPAPTFDLGLGPAGNLITTTEDLLQFARWLMREDTSPVLSRKALDSMWLPQEGGTRFGIGFALGELEGAKSVGHGGAIYGHSALLQIIPERKWAAVAFAAKDSADYVLGPLVRLASKPSSNYVPQAAPAFPQLSVYSQAPVEFSSRAIGEYGWNFNKLYLLEHNGKLHCLIEWFALVQLEELGGNRYRFPDRTMYAGETLVIKPTGVEVGPVWFPKLPEPDRNFRVRMQKPLAELKRIAASSQPPVQPTNLRQPELVDLRKLSSSIHFDIRYATANNFMGAPLYSKHGAYLQKPAAAAVLAAHEALAKQGFGLLIHDAYRPWRVTKMFWDATPEAQRNFVANPATGSRHNRGCAVDLSLYDLKAGKPVAMPSGFDEFSDRAFPEYPGGTSHERWLRSVLRTAMEAQGFTVNEDEWWHYDFKDWRQYPVANISFEQLESR